MGRKKRTLNKKTLKHANKCWTSFWRWPQRRYVLLTERLPLEVIPFSILLGKILLGNFFPIWEIAPSDFILPLKIAQCSKKISMFDLVFFMSRILLKNKKKSPLLTKKKKKKNPLLKKKKKKKKKKS